MILEKHLPWSAVYKEWNQSEREGERENRQQREAFKHLKAKSQTLHMELQDLMFVLPGFCLTSTQYFSTTPQFFSFRWLVTILCHCVLEVPNLPFDFWRRRQLSYYC